MRNPRNPRRGVIVGGAPYLSRWSAALALGCLCSEVPRAAERGGEIRGKKIEYREER